MMKGDSYCIAGAIYQDNSGLDGDRAESQRVVNTSETQMRSSWSRKTTELSAGETRLPVKLAYYSVVTIGRVDAKTPDKALHFH